MDETANDNVSNETIKIKVTEPDAVPYTEPAGTFEGDEFDEEEDRSVRRRVSNLVGTMGQVSFNVATLPLNLLPRRSRYHAKRSIREGLLSVKLLFDDVAEAIDDGIVRSLEKDKARLEAQGEEIPPASSDNTLGSGI